MMYRDRRGWGFKVRRGLAADGGEPPYKGFFNKKGPYAETGWHGVRTLPWRESRAAAQKDLDAYAEKKKMLIASVIDE